MVRLILAAVLLLSWQGAQGAVECTDDAFCADVFQVGSRCVEGFCSNPFYQGGCLARMAPEGSNYKQQVRVCNSQDPPEAREMGYCRAPSMPQYKEVRINSQNWESAFFTTWILQILLSEMLGVPAAAESGVFGKKIDFYDATNRMDYGTSLDRASFERALELDGDCSRNIFDESNPDEYRACAHIAAEEWAETAAYTSAMVNDGILEPPLPLGALAEQNWFVPRFVAARHPEVTSYLGLKDRERVAELFPTPITWWKYCNEVSLDNCATDDGVAARAPEDEAEGDVMFKAGVYTGHFRHEDAQNCTKYPDTCYGHFANYPCGWATNFVQSTYHLNLPLKSTGSSENGGYSYGHLTQIWAAANATGSNLMQMWWRPEAMYEAYLGTDAEFVKVQLPPPTQACFDSRVQSSAVCEASLEEKVGSPLGSCENPVQALKKGTSPTLRLISQNPDMEPELWSPALDAVRNFQMSELHWGEMFQLWQERGTDPYGYDPREAVCQWVVDHLDTIQSYAPPNYPRIVQERDLGIEAASVGGSALAILTVILAAASVVLTYRKRGFKRMYYTNPVFLYSIELGMAMVALSSWLAAHSSEGTSCVSMVWLQNLGYTLALFPLVNRADAINKLLSSGKQMQHVHIESSTLIFKMGIFANGVALFLLLWTLLDTPRSVHFYEFAGVDGRGETIISSAQYCGAESGLWYSLSVAWKTVLLVFGGATAFMASRVREDMNDTRSLTHAIFIHLMFAVLNTTSLVIQENVNPAELVVYRGILSTVEILVVLLIFVYPKLLEKGEKADEDEQLPDLFLKTSILYAEIAGLSAWSSVREPAQVFKFLETIYTAFDGAADNRRVFKVETIGGTYVAATGIPHEQANHATTMAQFAKDLQALFRALSSELEVLYGPDTGSLTLRIGVHSGAVTGGFLKGKGARFQLFGDTVNIARQIQETAEKDQIQVSEQTGAILIKEGRGRWLSEREETIIIAGHGRMQTYWLSKRKKLKQLGASQSSMDISESETASDIGLWDITHETSPQEQKRRLVDWNVEVLANLIKQILARRSAQSLETKSSLENCTVEEETPLEEVKEIIWLPPFDAKISRRQKAHHEIVLPHEVLAQLRQFVSEVAEMYRENPFHNFAHASHVVMSTLKHLNRIIAPTDFETDLETQSRQRAAAALHDHTYGITSDPLTQFACVFSALIHDLDHPGVPNPQMIKEQPHMASVFKNRSVAEQNSFQLAWKTFMRSDFRDLKLAVCGTPTGLRRFRQLVINSVMATDLGDKQLKELRNARWQTAFSEQSFHSSSSDVNRKATIVIEHLIQASDVSHTMQHWEVYREWNENLFKEMYFAYRAGRAEQNPADTWYKGEIGFFDFYIIPLSKKLNDCGVFGISSDENLNYANQNKELWVTLGKNATAQMLEKYEREWDSSAKALSSGMDTIPEDLEDV